MATKAGVLHVDFWASAKQPDWAFGPEWWAAIRKWKGGAPTKMDDSAATAAVPTPEQISYQDLEVGALIHFNLQTLCTFAEGHSGTKCQKSGYLPPEENIRAWYPSRLDTDQWVETAVSFGARYAVLVVDHFSGFTLWFVPQTVFTHR